MPKVYPRPSPHQQYANHPWWPGKDLGLRDLKGAQRQEHQDVICRNRRLDGSWSHSQWASVRKSGYLVSTYTVELHYTHTTAWGDKITKTHYNNSCHCRSFAYKSEQQENKDLGNEMIKSWIFKYLKHLSVCLIKPWGQNCLVVGSCRSFGVVLWEMLTGEIPYKDVDSSAIIWGVGNNSLQLPVPESCPDGFKILLRQCWWVCLRPGKQPSRQRKKNLSLMFSVGQEVVFMFEHLVCFKLHSFILFHKLLIVPAVSNLKCVCS